MSKDELIEKLTNLNRDSDIERAHAMGEDLLLEFINDPEITHVWNLIAQKWHYA